MPHAWDHMQCPLYSNLFTVQIRVSQFTLKKQCESMDNILGSIVSDEQTRNKGSPFLES